MPLLECVPNVSEGRNVHVIEALAGAVESSSARLLDVHSDVDHHRSVFTFIGESDVVERGFLALGRLAVRLVDLRGHHGVHPRVGAVDVVPFVPLRGASMRDAVASAHRAGLAFAADTHVPVFFYGEAAARPDRRELPAIRRGGLETLADRMAQGWGPDAGPPAPHATAGVSVVGARGPLVAFNAVLETADLEVARRIARRSREATTGLPAVRALGVVLASRGLAQVAMNLIDYVRAPVRCVAEWLERAARSEGTAVREYELVGCAPADQFHAWPPHLPPVAGLKASQLLDPALFVERD
jgi:glutamate formiminotransferase